jgi:hypothetical protein
MNHQTLSLADMGQVGQQFHGVNEPFSGFQAALDAFATDESRGKYFFVGHG